MGSRRAPAARRFCYSCRLSSELREGHRLHGLSLARHDATMVVHLAEVVSEMGGKVREKRAGRLIDAPDLLGIRLGQVGFADLAHAGLHGGNRVVDLAQ